MTPSTSPSLLGDQEGTGTILLSSDRFCAVFSQAVLVRTYHLTLQGHWQWKEGSNLPESLRGQDSGSHVPLPGPNPCFHANEPDGHSLELYLEVREEPLPVLVVVVSN